MVEFVQANVGPLLVLGLILVIVAVGLRGDNSGSRAASCCAFSSEGDASTQSTSGWTGPKAKGDGSSPTSLVGESEPANQIHAANSSARPARLDPGEAMAAGNMGALRRTTLTIGRLGCGGGGALTIERALARTPGVRRVYVNPTTEMAYLEYNPAQVAPSELVAVIEDLGFKAGRPVAGG